MVWYCFRTKRIVFEYIPTTMPNYYHEALVCLVYGTFLGEWDAIRLCLPHNTCATNGHLAHELQDFQELLWSRVSWLGPRVLLLKESPIPFTESKDNSSIEILLLNSMWGTGIWSTPQETSAMQWFFCFFYDLPWTFCIGMNEMKLV